MEKFFKKILCEIAEEAYGEPVANFRIKINPEERKGFHGRYWGDKKIIEIYNLYRETEYIIATTIHELAHHVTNTRYNELAHNKLFYKTLKELLSAAVRLGYLDYKKARKKQDSRDIEMMEKYFGCIVEEYDPCNNPHANQSIIKVRNSFSIKDQLKERGYTYNSQEKVWQKEIDNSEADEEKQYVESLAQKVKADIMPYDAIELKIFYYIIVGDGAFDKRNQLKELGYWFGGYFQKDKWVKKVEGKDLLDEKRKLISLGIKFRVKNNL